MREYLGDKPECVMKVKELECEFRGGMPQGCTIDRSTLVDDLS